MFEKVTDATTALSGIRDNSIIAISGFNMPTTPEYLILELYKRFRDVGHPKNVFIISDALPAMPGRALDLVAEKIYGDPNQEFLSGALMPFLGFSPWLQKLVTENRIECFGWPIGITAYWFREVASGRPGLVTKIGVDTFLDPRKDGAALNERSRKSSLCKVSVLDIEGEEHLLYRAPKPDYALIRASASDEYGNLSMVDEGIRGTVFSIAQATKARPKQGTVVVQVRWLARAGTINPRDVDVPGPLVDYVTVAPKEFHWQTGTTEYDPRISYKIIPPMTGRPVDDLAVTPLKQSERVIARRVVVELVKLLEEKQAPILVNLGIGIPAFVSSVVTQEGLADFIQTVLESGPWGGFALSGADFGLAIGPYALSTVPDMFSNFEGGIIDAACLGFLQVDKEGNVNPSMLPERIFGPGGFPVIAGGAPRTYFAGSFTAGSSEIEISNNRLRIVEDGSIHKFVPSVFKVVFSSREAVKYGHEILYITERAVFRLAAGGLILEESAPGVDVDRDIVSKMAFEPKVSPSMKEMDERLFADGDMGLRNELVKKLK
jgi:acyl CoA:acetate/3-ketoacid CoA transferase